MSKNLVIGTEKVTYNQWAIKKYCCDDMKESFEFGIYLRENKLFIDADGIVRKEIKYCPFCSAKITVILNDKEKKKDKQQRD